MTSRLLDRVTILTLCLVVLALLYRKAEKSERARQENEDLEQRMFDRAKNNREWLGEQKSVDRLKTRG